MLRLHTRQNYIPKILMIRTRCLRFEGTLHFRDADFSDRWTGSSDVQVERTAGMSKELTASFSGDKTQR